MILVDVSLLAYAWDSRAPLHRPAVEWLDAAPIRGAFSHPPLITQLFRSMLLLKEGRAGP